jgi:hypothetical protein
MFQEDIITITFDNVCIGNPSTPRPEGPGLAFDPSGSTELAEVSGRGAQGYP